MKRMIAATMVALMMLASSAFAQTKENKTVVTSFYPIYLFTLNLTQNVPNVNLTNLAAPEVGCLHDYQLTTKDMKTLAGTDLFIVNGAGMESFLIDVASQFPSLEQVVATQGMQVDEQGNAHLWLTASGAKQMAQNIAAGLILAFPDNVGQIENNLDELSAHLDALDVKLMEGLKPHEGKSIITFHEAFPYFASAYGLNVAAVIEREPGEALNPTELKELVETVRSLENPPLFIEPQYPDLQAQTLSVETGAPVYTLDPIVTGPLGDEALTYYETIMIQNMQTLIEALS